MGYKKLAEELRKLGFEVSTTTVSTVLERHGVPPAPERGRAGSSWRVFLNHYKEQFLAFDFLPSRRWVSNAFAERWVRSVHKECLDKLIILNERHLRQVLHEYVAYYNTRRPHQGLEQDSPAGTLLDPREGKVRYRNVLGGILRDYYRDAA